MCRGCSRSVLESLLGCLLESVGFLDLGIARCGLLELKGISSRDLKRLERKGLGWVVVGATTLKRNSWGCFLWVHLGMGLLLGT
jgi:hypothetical protein